MDVAEVYRSQKETVLRNMLQVTSDDLTVSIYLLRARHSVHIYINVAFLLYSYAVTRYETRYEMLFQCALKSLHESA